AAGLGDRWAALGGAGLGLLVFGLLYLVPALVRPDALGGGDVKLAGVLGAFLGWLGWPSLGVGIVAGLVLGGLYGVIQLARGRGRTARVALGPWMLAGAWIGILVGSPLLGAYLGLFGL